MRSLPAGLLAGCIAVTTARAMPYGQNPDWPCAQRLVEHLEAGSYWSGPVHGDPNWRNDQALFAIVPGLADRTAPEADATARLNAYADSIPPARRAAEYPVLFAALVDQTNDERDPLIARLEQLGRRQRGMGDTIAALSTRLDGMKPDDPARNDVSGERDFDVRAFQETQHTMRYACEAPSAMERRLGALAKVLQGKMSGR